MYLWCFNTIFLCILYVLYFRVLQFLLFFCSKKYVCVSHTNRRILAHIDIYQMCAIMCYKIIYQSMCCIVSIRWENSEFIHSLKFHIVVNTSKNWHFKKWMMLCVSQFLMPFKTQFSTSPLCMPYVRMNGFLSVFAFLTLMEESNFFSFFRQKRANFYRSVGRSMTSCCAYTVKRILRL